MIPTLSSRDPVETVDTRNAEAFHCLRTEYIDAALAEIDRRYGSMDAHLRDGLGLDGYVLAKLRRTMLE